MILWQITAQLTKQKTCGIKIHSIFHNLFKDHGRNRYKINHRIRSIQNG